MNRDSPAPIRTGLLFKLALFIAALVAANEAGNWVINELGLALRPSTEPYLHRLIMTATVIYIILMALPFVPGIEVGLVMMAMFGAKIVPLVYLATVFALVLGFLMGRFIPHRTILDLLGQLRLRRARELLMRIGPRGPRERIEFILQRTSTRWVPFLMKHRYAAVAIALNVPGNAVIGGGGGISLAAGFSRLFSLPAYVATVSIAVAPLPLAIWLTGG